MIDMAKKRKKIVTGPKGTKMAVTKKKKSETYRKATRAEEMAGMTPKQRIQAAYERRGTVTAVPKKKKKSR